MKAWQDERYYWLALYLVPGLGHTVFRSLLENFGRPEAVFEAGVSELVKARGVRDDVARKIAGKEFSTDPEKELRKVERAGARIVTYLDPSYPKLLKEIHNPPALLYIKGQDIPSNQTHVAVVGSRNATHYGLRAAERIGMGLARRRVGVVSGLAKGVDSAAHKGCLREKGFTIAVMGTGIDRVYPAGNKRLMDQVAESGAVITEFPMGSPPEPKNFPIRNRIISGLSRGVVVVEATKQSGSLITASLALDQGREVFAVPGSINSFKSRGAHFLIKQGAKLIENADDILDEFGFHRGTAQVGAGLRASVEALPEMDEFQRKLYDIICDYPIHIDQIVRKGDMDAGEVSGILMEMELKGLVKQLPGKMFVR